MIKRLKSGPVADYRKSKYADLIAIVKSLDVEECATYSVLPDENPETIRNRVDSGVRHHCQGMHLSFFRSEDQTEILVQRVS